MNTEDSLKKRIIFLRLKGKTYSEISNELNCVKSTVSYHCKNANIANSNIIKSPTKEEIGEMQKYYNVCKSSIKTANRFGWSKWTVLKYVKTKKRKILTENERKQKSIDASLRSRRILKEKLVEYKGGKCEICGYDRCIKAMDFHHRNPKEKEFALTYMNRKWEALVNEVDKCILVCSNCHKEIHANFILL